MPAIRIVRRSTYDRTIDVACPHCTKAIAVSAKNVERLEDGVEITAPCDHCTQLVTFGEQDLDGPIHPRTCPKCGWPIEPANPGGQTAFAEERGRGAGFNAGIRIPPGCSNPACDWVNRPNA